MNKKLFKKLLAAVLSAAMVLNLNVSTAAAEDSVKVKNVYTNIQKATMATGTTRQITTYTEPENAANQGMRFATSDKSVATVSTSGLVKAIAPGTAVITVTSKDNSKATEKVTITVLDNLTIDKSMVDADNEIILMDETYGNVYIDNSVGDAGIYLSEVNIKNNLVLEKGDYKVYLYETTAASVEVKSTLDDITSFSTAAVEGVPGLFVYNNSSVNAVNSGLGLNISQDETSEVNTITFNFSGDEDYDLSLEGFTGNLVINMTGGGNINLGALGCNIQNVTVIGSAGAGSVQLSNTAASQIGNMTVGGSANVNLKVPAATLNIGKDASGATVSIGAAVASLNNSGANTRLTVGSEIGTLNSTGSGAAVQLLEGGTINENTTNTPTVNINTSGTVVLIPSGSTPAPSTSLSYNVGDVILYNTFEDGRISIVKNNSPVFVLANIGKDSSKSLLTVGRTQPYFTPAISLAAYAPSVAGKHITVRVTADLMYDSGNLDSQQFKCTVNGTYSQVAVTTANKGQWSTLTGTYKVTDANTLIYFETVSGSTNTKDDFYIDNVKVEIFAVEDRIFTNGISVAPAAATIGIGQQQQLTATVSPVGAENTAVTWSTSNPSVAWVNSSGLVTAVGGGTATIIATAANGTYKASSVITVDPNIRIYNIKLDKNSRMITEIGGTVQLSAIATMNLVPINANVTWESSETEVATVNANGLVTAVNNGEAIITASVELDEVTYSAEFKLIVDTSLVLLNDFENLPVGTGFGTMQYTSGDITAVVVEQSEVNNNHVVKVMPKNYGASAKYSITLPEGKTLADYSGIVVDVLWASGDIGSKQLRAEAGTTLTGNFNQTNNLIGTVSNGIGGAQTQFTKHTIPLSGDRLSTLSGTFELAIGIHCGASAGGNPTIYYVDNIALVKKEPTPITRVALNNKAITLNLEEEQTLTAKILPAAATTSKDLTWESSNLSVASVDANGKVTAKGPGTATITVRTKVDGVSDVEHTATCIVTVTSVEGMKLNRTYVIFTTLGETVQLTSNKPDMSWSSDNTAVAAVAADGTVTAGEDGKAVITGTSGSMSKTCTIVVNSKAVFIEDFEDGIIDSALSIDVGTLTVKSYADDRVAAHDGDKSLLVQPQDDANRQYHGIQYEFTNNSGSTKKYQMSAFVRGAVPGDITVMCWKNGPSYNTYDDDSAVGPDNWVLLDSATNSGPIEVAHGATFQVRFRSATGDPFYIDDIMITDVTPEPSGETPVIEFDPFDIATNSAFTGTGDGSNNTGWVDFYTNNDNLKNKASAGGITDTSILNKFLTWNGVKEAVKSFEITMTLTEATSKDMNNIGYSILVQNLVDGSWSGGSYKSFNGNTGVTSVSGSSITVTEVINLSEVAWNSVDTSAGKIAVRFTNIETGANVAGTITIKVNSYKEEALFADFNAASNQSFSLSGTNWNDVYLNNTNFRTKASASGIIDTALLDKFLTWEGIKEVVKGFEITITINGGTAASGNLIANVLIQNQKTEGGWNGSYKQFEQDMGVSSVSSPVTVTKQILIDDVAWDATDTVSGKISLQFKNADGTPVTGTWSIKVLSR